MADITYIDRRSQKRETEKVYGKALIELLYGHGFFSKLLSYLFLPLFSRIHFLSWAYGAFQKSSLSRFKVKPFIECFQVDSSEFLNPADSFCSFNDFFIRKLKPSARPMSGGKEIAVLPADARYLVFPNIQDSEGFWIKGKKFNLADLLQDAALAARYEKGSMLIARLCPVDYHRFHFPCDCIPSEPRLINGALFSVNPIALKKNINFLSENKRVITTLKSTVFGEILYIEVGATNVGSICQTYQSNVECAKGAEKGYFSFGGSCLILLFEPRKIIFDQDLIEASKNIIEVRGLLGQSLGRSIS